MAVPEVFLTLPVSLETLEHRAIVHRGRLGEPSSAVGLLCGPTDQVSRTVLDALPKLRVIGVAGAGTDGLDSVELAARGIGVVTAPEGTTEATAELAFCLMLMASRNVGQEESRLREGRWTGWSFDHLAGRELYGGTLGLVGYGRIGQAVAARAVSFGMHVLHHCRTPTGKDGYISKLDDLLAQSDILSLHVPLTYETDGLIGRRELELLPNGAIVINTARGQILDELALCDLLDSGALHSAALDVYDDEPQVPRRLLKTDNLILTPHIGSATERSRTAMARIAAERLLVALAEVASPPPSGTTEMPKDSQLPRHPIDPSLGVEGTINPSTPRHPGSM